MDWDRIFVTVMVTCVAIKLFGPSLAYIAGVTWRGIFRHFGS